MSCIGASVQLWGLSLLPVLKCNFEIQGARSAFASAQNSTNFCLLWPSHQHDGKSGHRLSTYSGLMHRLLF